jgi:hypothetical protein
MRLTASVRKDTGTTTHLLAATTPLGDATQLASAERVEIVDSEGGFLLVRYSASGEFVGDTWHVTVDEAKQQAKFEFEIDVADWKEENAPAFG